jgi:LPXTG-motif cell wall-anchored protein
LDFCDGTLAEDNDAMARRLASLVTAALLVTTLVPALAVADGDPASDVLLGANVFYPYTPSVAPSVQRELNAETAAAKQAGFPVKVALIASPVDLGVIPSVFGKPQTYADFLDQEISFVRAQPLLVVMAAGYGVQGIKAPAGAALDGLAKPGGTSSTELAQAAITAVAKLAAASKHPITEPSAASTPRNTGGNGSTTPIVIGLAVAIVLVASALIVLRRRQGSRPTRR